MSISDITPAMLPASAASTENRAVGPKANARNQGQTQGQGQGQGQAPDDDTSGRNGPTTGQNGPTIRLVAVNGKKSAARQVTNTDSQDATQAVAQGAFVSLLAQMEQKVADTQGQAPQGNGPTDTGETLPATGQSAAAAIGATATGGGSRVQLLQNQLAALMASQSAAAEQAATTPSGGAAASAAGASNASVAKLAPKLTVVSSQAPVAAGTTRNSDALTKFSNLLNSVQGATQSQGASAQGDNGASADKDAPFQDKADPAATAAGADMPVQMAPVMAQDSLPVAGKSPALQIAGRIADALQTSAPIAADAAMPATDTGPQVLTVRLHPEGLGMVAVRLEKSDGGLKINLSAEHAGTSDHLKASAGELVSALQDVAPQFSSSDLSFGQSNKQAGGGAFGSGAQQGQGGVSGNGNSNKQDFNGQGNAGQGAPGRSFRADASDRADDTSAAVGRAVGGIYL